MNENANENNWIYETVFHCTEPFMFILLSSRYDWNTEEKGLTNLDLGSPLDP